MVEHRRVLNLCLSTGSGVVRIKGAVPLIVVSKLKLLAGTAARKRSEVVYLPEHLSFSAVSRYEECPRSWFLSYARKAEPRQTWFFPMGSAVHESIEAYVSTGKVPEFESVFYPLIEKQLLIDPDHHNWLSAGSREHLVQGAVAVETGKRCVESAVRFLQDVDVWEIEYDASGYLPNCEVPVKAYIDLLGHHKKHGPVVVDWKTGKSGPNDIFQLEVYSALLQAGDTSSIRPYLASQQGYWGMLHPEAKPKTAKGRLKDLSHVKPEDVGARFQRAYEGMKKAIYKANKDRFKCGFCVMQDNCKAHNAPLQTERTIFYDTSAQDGIPF